MTPNHTSFWRGLGGALDRLGEFAVTGCALALLMMLLLMCTEIGMRLFFNSSTQISEEYSGYLFTWVTLGCFLYAQRAERFLRVDAVRKMIRPRVRAGMDCFAAFAGAALSAILLYATGETFSSSLMFHSTSMQYSETPLYLPQVIMPIGFGLLTIAFLHTAITELLKAAGRLPITADSSDNTPLALHE